MTSGESMRKWGPDNTPSSVGVTFLRDRPSSEHVVSSTRRYTDAAVFAFDY